MEVNLLTPRRTASVWPVVIRMERTNLPSTKELVLELTQNTYKAGGENATGNVIPEQTEETVEDSTQRSIRDMLDDEGEASVFVNRDPSSRTRSSMKSESSDVMTNSSPSFRF